MKTDERDRIHLEPFLILTLSLLIGAAFQQGVFQEYMAQAAAMASLCLLHLALMGYVRYMGRHLTRFLRSLKRRLGSLASPAGNDAPDELQLALLAAESQAEPNQPERKEPTIWSSGQWLGNIEPAPITRV